MTSKRNENMSDVRESEFAMSVKNKQIHPDVDMSDNGYTFDKKMSKGCEIQAQGTALYDDLVPGDIILSDGAYWETIDATPDEDQRLFPGVTIVGCRAVKDGKTVSFAVQGLLRRDYHEVVPSDIKKAWRLVKECSMEIKP